MSILCYSEVFSVKFLFYGLYKETSEYFFFRDKADYSEFGIISRSLSQVSGKELPMNEAICSLSLPESLKPKSLAILSLRMYPDCLVLKKGGLSKSSLKRFASWGIAVNGLSTPRALPSGADSAGFGVPQSRKRVYLAGCLGVDCTGKILAFGKSNEENSRKVKQLIGESQGQRVYAPDGLAVTQCSGSGGMGGNSSLGALLNINVNGEVKNANNSVVYSKYGNITIENDSTANVNGLIYAPLGTVTINSPNVTINGIIIAEQVVINGSSVNINCNDNIARFIGETPEKYDFSGLEYLPEEWLGDTDSDELCDIYEKVIDSDLNNPDTDSDYLPDGYEVLMLFTDPIEKDSDGNGIFDGDEDFDTDNLANLGEYRYNTLPFVPDSDEDGLSDGDEVHIYNTIPDNPDTDEDKLLDGDEGYEGCIYKKYGIYFDPLNPDTDGDTIVDGDEVFEQTKEQEVQTQDEAITEVFVEMDANGNVEKNLKIESMYNIDAMSTNVHALIGEPFNFETESSFESATISFKIDQSKLGNTQFDKLLILWYNEEDQIFEEMPTTHDAVNSTVSTTTTHFSQYMIVDSVEWYDNWNASIEALQGMWSGNTTYTRNLHTIYLVDCSTSMASMDPYGRSLEIGYKGITAENIEEKRKEIDSPGEEEAYTVPWCQRADICKALLDRKGENEAACLITFSDGIINDFGISNDYEYTKEKIPEISGKEGVADFNNAFSRALSYVVTDTTDLYRIVVITNSDIEYDLEDLPYIPSNVMLNFFNFGEIALDASLEELAIDTHGGVFDVTTKESLLVQAGEVVTIPSKFIGEDSDEDNIPNLVEEFGLKPNGSPIGTNPYKKDTDDDDIPDNEELGLVIGLLEENFDVYEYVRALNPHSDPANDDTDGDGLNDGKRGEYNGKVLLPIDPNPTKYDGPNGIWQTQKKVADSGMYETSFLSDNHDINAELFLLGAAKSEELIDELLTHPKTLTIAYANAFEAMFKDYAENKDVTVAGADFLDFSLDEGGIVYHSHVITWQMFFGYNDLYDIIFENGSNMNNNPITFHYENQEHILWLWKGDYWNLQSGAEMGIYKYDETIGNYKHYDAVSFLLPMTLSLYNIEDSQIQNVFTWAPDENQWWITGFNPEFTDPDPEKMVMVSSVDFSEQEGMYHAFKESYEPNELFDIIFDDELEIAWFAWN